ncbi:hypothetical protein OUO20_02220 [Arthrobacter sp. FX8]|uniref:hypothetical protein n=1 Tax=Micrococcaceae TaxID=1268 RepID=UPI000B07E341|nr:MULTISPECIES: hypothetical protein [unclassified Arthrobacter]WAJ33857.1 hypothetical protein OUO20_02220 [Arthrobacter sp. FX8]
MATSEEYRAVYGQEAPGGQAPAEIGDGGCNIIFKDNGAVVGRWSSWEKASVALNRLQKLSGWLEYRLEESHRWVRAKGAGDTMRCSGCSALRQLQEAAGPLAPRGFGW